MYGLGRNSTQPKRRTKLAPAHQSGTATYHRRSAGGNRFTERRIRRSAQSMPPLTRYGVLVYHFSFSTRYGPEHAMTSIRTISANSATAREGAVV